MKDILLENLINKSYYNYDDWAKMVNSEKINFAQIQNFFDQNKEKIENSLDKLEITEINLLFSFVSFKIRIYNYDDYAKNYDDRAKKDMYLAKFFLFEFLCNYLLNRSDKDSFLKENFVRIIQQAFLSNNDHHNDREKIYRNVIIDVITKYCLKNNNIPTKFTLFLTKKFANERNFLGSFDPTDPEKRLIPPQDIQKQIAAYISANSPSISYIPDITFSDFEKQQLAQYMGFSESKREINKRYINRSFPCFYLKFEADRTKIMNNSLSSEKICTPIAEAFLNNQEDSFSFNNFSFCSPSDYEKLCFKNLLEESTKLMKQIVNIADKRALKFLESELAQKNTSFEDKEEDLAIKTPEIASFQLEQDNPHFLEKREKDLAIDTSEISNSNTNLTPRMTKTISNIGAVV